MMKKQQVIIYIFFLLGLMMTACNKNQQPNTLVVGVTAGPHYEIMQCVMKQCEDQGIHLKIVEFNDFILPNEALAQGDLDMNSYQHQPFLDSQQPIRGYSFVGIAKTILMPMRLYSLKYTDVRHIPHQATIGIPSDPSNCARALLLLEQAGMIRLNQESRSMPTILDVAENLLSLRFMEMDAAQLPRALPDLDVAAINTDWALLSKLTANSIIFEEASDSPYANIIVIREQDTKLPLIKQFIDIYQSEKTKDFIRKRFGESVIPVW